MAIVDGHIRCSGCGEMKPLDAFAPSFAKRGRGRCRPCNVRHGKAWSRTASIESLARVREARRRDWELSTNYGMTAAQYDAMLAEQGGCCACCGATANPSGKRLFVDHDHATGAIRGVICNKCNAGIGSLGDTVEGVRRALNYLERAQQPLSRVEPTMRINLMRGAN